MQEILKELELSADDPESIDRLIHLLDELLGLLTGIDNAKNFCKIGGMYYIFRLALAQDLDKRIRNLAFVILVDCS